MRFLSFFLFFSLLSLVSGHNFLITPSRADLSSTVKPCMPKIGTDPHIQVNPGQLFQMEWSAGHGNNCALGYGVRKENRKDQQRKNSHKLTHFPYLFLLFQCPVSTYFIFLHASDYDRLYDDTKLMAAVGEYIRTAPPSGFLTDPIWRRNHITGRVNRVQDYDSSYFTYFDKQVQNATQGPFISRDPIMVSKSESDAITFGVNPNPSQWVYKDTQLTTDTRVDYYNPRFPWIESVHRFDIGVQQISYAHTFDTANFRIQARKGPGNYIGFYRWFGYVDCVDINVQPASNPVVNRYGTMVPGSKPIFTRLDHCEFNVVYSPSTPCRIMDPKVMSVQQCLTDCLNNNYGYYQGCRAVQVVRASNLPISLPREINVPPFFNGTLDKGGHFLIDPQCGIPYAPKRIANGCKVEPTCDLDAMGAKPTDYICYGTEVNVDPGKQATQVFTIGPEPEDPRFFSTCYFQSADGGFLPIPGYSDLPPPWKAGDYCINCDFVNKVKNLGKGYTPNWEEGLVMGAGPCQKCY